MKKHAFTPSFVVYFTALILCGGLQSWLKLSYVDLETGFYQASTLPKVLHIILAAAIVLLFLIYLLRRPYRDYPILRRGYLLPFLALVTSGALLLYSLEVLRFLPFGHQNPGIQMSGRSLWICGVLGLIAGAGFLATSFAGLANGRMPGGSLSLPAGIWMLLMLISRFNSYPTLTTISDNLLAVLFMVFASMFLVGHSRTLSGLARKDGRNYVVPAGLTASLLGFLLVIPNWLWLAVHPTLVMPAPLLGSMESIFVFALSLYALFFTLHLRHSIASV